LNISCWYRETVYQFFCLFIEVPLTQHNHSAHILFFFSNPTGPFCTHVSKKMSQIRDLPKRIT
jgi:hypothetical protein